MEAVLTTCFVLGVSAGWYFYRRRKHDIRLHTDAPSLRLNGGGTYQYQVIGVSRYQSALARIYGDLDINQEKDAQAILVQEKGQKKHKDAVVVRIEIDGGVVGFLPGDVAAEYRRRLIDAGYPDAAAACKAKITARRSAGSGAEFYYCVRLDLPPRRDH